MEKTRGNPTHTQTAEAKNTETKKRRIGRGIEREGEKGKRKQGGEENGGRKKGERRMQREKGYTKGRGGGEEATGEA